MLKTRSCHSLILIGFIGVCGLATFAPAHADKIIFPRDFAPTEGPVADVEKPTRDAICLNGTWQFQIEHLPPGYDKATGHPPDLAMPVADRWEKVPVKVPSPWNVNRFKFTHGKGPDFRTYPSYPAAWDEVDMGWLRRSFQAPDAWKGKRVILRFNAVMGRARIFLNGQEVGRHIDNYLPFSFDVTDLVKFGADNDLLVGVQSSALFDVAGHYGRQTYAGGSFWSSSSVTGIWQDVYLEAVPAVRIDNVFVQPDVAQDELKTDVTLKNDTDSAASVSLGGVVHPWQNLAGKDVLSAPEPKWTLGAETSVSYLATPVTVPPHSATTVTLTQKTDGHLALWSPDHPNLHGLVLSLQDKSGASLDTKYTRFGWRQFTMEGKTVKLNGTPIIFKGDAAHFMGIPSLTRRYAWAWFTAVKAANGNVVRLHALPYPAFYLDMADEIGICTLDETAIWGSGGGPKLDSDEFWEAAHQHETDLVLRDRNHPCVMGWSVMNEVFAFVDGLYHSPPDLMPRLKKEYATMAAIVRKNDPTHPWISADGDHDGLGEMPVFMIHYIGEDWMKKLQKGDRPWGDGENSGAYSNTPEQTARFNGERAYESYDARMEGEATEAYQILKAHDHYGSNYRSVFNILWYALQPLPLGLADTTKAPTLDDGIFFGPYVENKPGVQPERLGPYIETVNPGYDPSLPLYETFPMFDAIHDGFASPMIPSKWDHPPPKPETTPAITVKPVQNIQLLAGTGSQLGAHLTRQGVSFASSGDPDLVFVDGAVPPDAAQKSTIDACLQRGGTVFVWGVAQPTLSQLNALLPAPLEVTSRQASSLLPVTDDPVIAGLKPSDLFFAELDPSTILDGGLDGPLVAQGKVLLKASDADWKLWNPNDAETEVAQVLRSEREAKPSGAALVEVPQGAGRLLVCNIPCSGSIAKRKALVDRLLTNLGVPLAAAHEDVEALNEDGEVTQALFCGAFGVPSIKEGLAATIIDPASGESIHAGAPAAQGMKWRALKAVGTMFDFFKIDVEGPKEKAAVYFSFWMVSPRALDNLLVEPNIPKLDLLITSKDASQVWLNGKPVSLQAQSGTATAAGLPVQKGWNHFLIKDVHDRDEWQFKMKFQCDKPEYLNSVKTPLEKAAE